MIRLGSSLPPLHKIQLWFALAVVGAAPVAAQQARPTVSDDSLHITGIFNSDLPRTERKFHLRLVVHPHFGDFTQRDNLRVPITLIYGVTSRWELSEETDTYFAHGLGKERLFSRAGFSALGVATKYRIGDQLWPGWDIGVSAGYISPIDHPPAEVTDALRHFTTSITFAHQLENHPAIRVFFAPSSDLVTHTTLAFEPTKNQLRDNSQGLTVGAVWERGVMTYTLETGYFTTRLTGHTSQDLYQVRPGFVFVIPRKWTFHAKGQWLFGLSMTASHGPDGNHFTFSGKLRINFDFKRHKEPAP